VVVLRAHHGGPGRCQLSVERSRLSLGGPGPSPSEAVLGRARARWGDVLPAAQTIHGNSEEPGGMRSMALKPVNDRLGDLTLQDLMTIRFPKD
jgi:hypothetical protein